MNHELDTRLPEINKRRGGMYKIAKNTDCDLIVSITSKDPIYYKETFVRSNVTATLNYDFGRENVKFISITKDTENKQWNLIYKILKLK